MNVIGRAHLGVETVRNKRIQRRGMLGLCAMLKGSQGVALVITFVNMFLNQDDTGVLA